jgi:hypothetical protein
MKHTSTRKLGTCAISFIFWMSIDKMLLFAALRQLHIADLPLVDACRT